MVFTNFVDTHQRKMFQNHPVPSKKREPRKKFYRQWKLWRIMALWLELETLFLTSEKETPAS